MNITTDPDLEYWPFREKLASAKAEKDFGKDASSKRHVTLVLIRPILLSATPFWSGVTRGLPTNSFALSGSFEFFLLPFDGLVKLSFYHCNKRINLAVTSDFFQRGYTSGEEYKRIVTAIQANIG